MMKRVCCASVYGLHAGADDYSAFKVDGISGATRTAQGVDGMMRFWLDEFGFAPYLQRIREEQAYAG